MICVYPHVRPGGEDQAVWLPWTIRSLPSVGIIMWEWHNIMRGNHKRLAGSHQRLTPGKKWLIRGPPKTPLRCLRRPLPKFAVFYPRKISRFLSFFLRPAARRAAAPFFIPDPSSGLPAVLLSHFLSSGWLRPPYALERQCTFST